MENQNKYWQDFRELWTFQNPCSGNCTRKYFVPQCVLSSGICHHSRHISISTHQFLQCLCFLLGFFFLGCIYREGLCTEVCRKGGESWAVSSRNAQCRFKPNTTNTLLQCDCFLSSTLRLSLSLRTGRHVRTLLHFSRCIICSVLGAIQGAWCQQWWQLGDGMKEHARAKGGAREMRSVGMEQIDSGGWVELQNILMKYRTNHYKSLPEKVLEYIPPKLSQQLRVINIKR